MSEPASWDTDVLHVSDTFGRRIRQDPFHQLGVPTHLLALEAGRRGENARAADLAAYVPEEFGLLMRTVLNGWLRQLQEHVVDQLGIPQLTTMLRVPGMHVWEAFYDVGSSACASAVLALRDGDLGAAGVHLETTRSVFKTINDETVRYIQDLLTALDELGGEAAPIASLRGAYDSIWRERYRGWNALTALEKLYLTCEGMRTHYGGPLRDGSFVVRDEGDRYRLDFAYCGTGGMLRYGDTETGEGPWPTTGVNRTPQPWTWDKTGVPWYCTHCSLFLEHWPQEDFGHPLRPVLYDDDPGSPLSTSWFVYKAAPGASGPVDRA